MGGSTTISNSETKAEALKLQSSSFGVPITLLHGTVRVPVNLIDYGDFTAIEHTSKQSNGGKGGGGVTVVNTTYTYTASAILAICAGPITGLRTIWRGKQKYEQGVSPMAAAADVFFGLVDQPVWSVLSTMHGGTHAQNYSGTAYLAFQDYDLGGTASLENHNVEVYGPGCNDPAADVPDANPARIGRDWLCHWSGLGLAESILGDLEPYSNYCYAAGLLLSSALTEQAPAADRFRQLGLLTNSTLLTVDGKVHVVPLGTEALARTYPAVPGPTATYTYTPDNTALFNLTPDHLLDRGDLPLVSIRRKSPADAYNIVEVEFTDRQNDYAIGYATVKDQTSIDLYGAKPAPKIKAPWICEHEIAERLGWIELQRYLTVLNEYEFELPWHFAALLPKNIVTLTVPDQDLNAYAVRIETIKETRDGFELMAEDFLGSVPAAPAYQLPGVDGFTHDYAVAPGDTDLLAVFEAPYELTESGLEVWLAVNGTTPGWGGCHIWVSADGAEYRRVDTQWGRTRAGQLSGPVSSSLTSFGVDNMSGELLSGSALDASVGATLCYIGGSNPEFVSYQTATLTGAGAYTLGSVLRGAYGSLTKAHADNSPFVRCDDAVAKSGPLGKVMIGRQLYIKLQSFNIFGLRVQDLADVDPHVYTVTGRWALQTDSANLCAEGNFEVTPLGQRPATWSGGTVVAVTGQPFVAALRLTELYTSEDQNRLEATEGASYYLSAAMDASASGSAALLGLRFYDAAGTFLSFSGVGAPTLAGELPIYAGESWRRFAGPVVAPPGSAYGLISVRRDSTVGYVDLADVRVLRQAPTAGIEPGAATDVLSVSVPSYTVGAVLDNSGVVGSVVVPSVDVDVIAVVSVDMPSVYYKNASSGFSASFGGFCEYWVRPGPFIGSISQAAFGPGPGANREVYSGTSKTGQVQIAANSGPLTFELRAGKAVLGDVVTLSRVEFKVELIKL